MVWLILIVGLLNLGIGFALAVYFDRSPSVLRVLPEPNSSDDPADPRSSTKSASEQSGQCPSPENQQQDEQNSDQGEEGGASEERVDDEAVEEGEAEVEEEDEGEEEEDDESPLVEQIPREWLEILEQEHIIASSFVEASVEVLRLRVGQYRERLVAIDDHVRDCDADSDEAELQSLNLELREVNEDWLDQQSSAAKHLSNRAGKLGDLESLAKDLKHILSDQTSQIKQTCRDIGKLDFSSSREAARQRLITEIRKLLDLAHALRDQMSISLLAIVKAEGRLNELEPELRSDPLTGLLNRCGLEKTFSDLWYDDPNRLRQVSCAMLDIDQFAMLLERFGAPACDRLIASFASVLASVIRNDRGFDLAVRLAGQRFFLFFGDTGPRKGTSAVERIRQTIAASHFEILHEEVELTVSCSVTEVQNDDTTETIYARLGRCLREAKRAGRNRTYLDEGHGPQQVEPPEFVVTGRVVRVGS